MTKKLVDAIRTQKKSSVQKNLRILGTLGIPLGGQKLVEVPNRNSFVYVKLRDNQNEVIQAFNNQVAPSYGLPVIVERQNNRYIVLEVDTLRYQNNWSNFSPYLPRHGNTHSFDTDTGGGGDTVWVHSRQIMPALILPSGTYGGPDVLLASYTIKNSDGSWKYVGNTGTQNLTPYKPTGSMAVMVLVYLDSISGNPYLMVGSGSYFSASITGTSAIVPYIPSLTNPNHIPLSAVRLVSGTRSIGWDNIYDVRQFIHTIPTGTGGGGTISIQDEGSGLGDANTINFVGNNVSTTLTGGVARVFITGSTGGGSSIDVEHEGTPQGTFNTLNFVGDWVNITTNGTIANINITGSNNINLTGTSLGENTVLVGTSNTGKLLTLPWLAWGSNNSIEFAANNPSKEANAGVIGYETFTPGFLEIVGAGTSAGDRWVRAYDNLYVNTHLKTASAQILGLANTFPYLNGTGTFVYPYTNAPGKTYVTGSDLFLMLNSEDSHSSVLVRVDDVVINLSSASPRVYTATGTHTWSKPDDLRYIIVELVGGGGGGGGAGATAAATVSAGRSAGGAGYSKKKINVGQLGATETITVGGGGAGGAAGASGVTGGTSSFGSHLSAAGGQGGTAGAASANIAVEARSGGIGSGGDINTAGSPSSPGVYLGTVQAFSGSGGSSYFGGGAAGVRSNSNSVSGNPGREYGGGGSGGANSNSESAVGGGKGGDGVVIVWEYVTGNM